MIAALNHDSLPPTLHVDRAQPAHRLVSRHRSATHRAGALAGHRSSPHRGGVLVRDQRHQRAPDPATSPHPAGRTGCDRRTPRTGVEFGLPMWPVSARTPAALCAQADRLHQHLIGHPDLDLTDVAYSLATTRTHHPYRAVITAPVATADPRQELLDALDALRAGQPHPQLTRHHYLAHLRGKTVFVLPGQGAQYPGMGRRALRTPPRLRRHRR